MVKMHSNTTLLCSDTDYNNKTHTSNRLTTSEKTQMVNICN